MTWSLRVTVLVALLGCAFGLAVLASIAEARPGGGQSSSRSSSSSSSRSSSSSSSRSSSSSPSRSSSSSSSSRSYSGGGGGGGGGGMAFIGVMVGLLVVVGVIVAIAKAGENRDQWSSTVHVPAGPPKHEPPNLRPLLESDPEFSQAVFEDFVFQLYSAAQRGRNDPAKLAALAPYLSPDVAGKLADRGATPSQVVIGTLRLSSVKRRGKDSVDRIGVHIEATLISERPSYVVESWFFVRGVGVQSKPPVANRTWPCPNCGAAWQSDKHENTAELRKCQHCGEDMQIGKFDWCLNGINVQSSESALASLTGTVEEYGNDLETVVARDAMTNMEAITKNDPEVTWDAVKGRFGLIYRRLNEGWNESDLTPVRGLTTRPLRGYLQYWLDEYKRQGLRNRLDNAAIENIKLAKIVRDKHFDAVTARVTAAGCDYTTDENKNLVGGSRTNTRRYTEYWTLIRSSARRGPVNAEPKCPNCGAPLMVGDAGDCMHCEVAIESGGFDWVLSKIEQDDSYAG